jgi:hypothetical protein
MNERVKIRIADEHSAADRNQSSADFQVGCIAGFQTSRRFAVAIHADLEIGDTAGWETCATSSGYALGEFAQPAKTFTDSSADNTIKV